MHAEQVGVWVCVRALGRGSVIINLLGKGNGPLSILIVVKIYGWLGGNAGGEEGGD